MSSFSPFFAVGVPVCACVRLLWNPPSRKANAAAAGRCSTAAWSASTPPGGLTRAPAKPRRPPPRKRPPHPAGPLCWTPLAPPARSVAGHLISARTACSAVSASACSTAARPRQKAHWRAHREVRGGRAGVRARASWRGRGINLKRAFTKAAVEFGAESIEALRCMSIRFDEAGALFPQGAGGESAHAG